MFPRCGMAQEGDEARYMTIKDIARQCGVSVSTVSRVLNDRPDVSPENRRKVLSAIQQSNYIPNNTARDLVKTKSDAIGLVVRGVSNPFYTDIIRVIEEQVTARGYTLVMQQIGTCDDEVKRGAMMEQEKRLRGLILLGGRSDYSPQELAPLNIPFVCCSYTNQYGTLPSDSYASVSIADEEEAYRAVSGCTAAGTGALRRWYPARRTAPSASCGIRGLCPGPGGSRPAPGAGAGHRGRILRHPAGVSGGAAAADGGARFTALFAISDNMAIGAMRALREAGQQIPGTAPSSPSTD